MPSRSNQNSLTSLSRTARQCTGLDEEQKSTLLQITMSDAESRYCSNKLAIIHWDEYVSSAGNNRLPGPACSPSRIIASYSKNRSITSLGFHIPVQSPFVGCGTSRTVNKSVEVNCDGVGICTLDGLTARDYSSEPVLVVVEGLGGTNWVVMMAQDVTCKISV
jgi:hypothetical protein